MLLYFQFQQLILFELKLTQTTDRQRYRDQLSNCLNFLQNQSFTKNVPQQFAEPGLLGELEA